MNKHKREWYIEKGSEMVKDEESTAVAYTSERNGNLYGMGFRGRAGKPAWQYRFGTEARRDEYIKAFFESTCANEAYKREQQTKKKSFKHDLKVGDVLYTSWGYDQTNVEFFQVTRTTEKCVDVARISGCTVSSSHGCDRVKPCKDSFITEGYGCESYQNKRVSQYGIRISECRTAWKYEKGDEGTHQTSAGWGH